MTCFKDSKKQTHTVGARKLRLTRHPVRRVHSMEIKMDYEIRLGPGKLKTKTHLRSYSVILIGIKGNGPAQNFQNIVFMRHVSEGNLKEGFSF